MIRCRRASTSVGWACSSRVVRATGPGNLGGSPKVPPESSSLTRTGLGDVVGESRQRSFPDEHQHQFDDVISMIRR